MRYIANNRRRSFVAALARWRAGLTTGRVIFSFIAALIDAWVLLIEIQR
jgi:hypothetical protein